MTKGEREQQLKTFIGSEKTLLLVTGEYRDVSNGKVIADAVFFYGVPKTRYNKFPMPDNVFTITHDLM